MRCTKFDKELSVWNSKRCRLLCLWKKLVQETKGAAQHLTSKRPVIQRLLSKCPAAPWWNSRCPETTAGSSPVSNSKHCVVQLELGATVGSPWKDALNPEAEIDFARIPHVCGERAFEVLALKCIIGYLTCKSAIEPTLSECLQHEELATFGHCITVFKLPQ